MSKSRGLKIVIELDKDLVGDVTSNAGAFTVTGLQKNPLPHGSPASKTYPVASVSRPGIATLLNEGFLTGTFDDTVKEPTGLMLSVEVPAAETEEKFDSSSTSGSSYTTSGNQVLIKQNGTLIKVTYKTRISGNHTLALKNANGSTTLRTASASSSGSGNWITFSFTALTVATNETYRIEVTHSSTTVWLRTGDYGGTLWSTTAGIFNTDVWAGYGIPMGLVFQTSALQYHETGTYTLAPIDVANLPTLVDVKVFWSETKPGSTSIIAEYGETASNTVPPTAWIEVSNEASVSVDTTEGNYFWLRFTLATEDEGATPSISAITLEEAEAPQNRIELNFTDANRFADVIGNLTVAYNAEVGTLAGQKPVESFEIPFAPAGLAPTQNFEHYISASMFSITNSITPIAWGTAYAGEHSVVASLFSMTHVINKL